MTYYRYDGEFNYIGQTEVEPMDSNWTLVPYIDSFNEPKFNVEIQLWYENAPLSDLAKTAIYLKRINSAFTILRQRALASSIGKSLSLFGFDYIKEQADQYKYKYDVARGAIVDAMAENMIENESVDFGITPLQMKAIVVERFELGQSIYIAYCSMIERGRTKAITAVELAQWEKAEQLTTMMESVPESLTMEEAVALSNQLLSI